MNEQKRDELLNILGLNAARIRLKLKEKNSEISI